MKHVLSLAFLAALSLLAGCAASVNTIENAQKSAKMYALCDARVETDSSLAHNFGVTRLFSARNRAGMLRVQMEVELLKCERMTINAKMEWYDESGMLVETAGGGWQQYVFEPRETLSLAFTAPSRDVCDFRLKLMRAE